MVAFGIAIDGISLFYDPVDPKAVVLEIPRYWINASPEQIDEVFQPGIRVT